jgi:hypothetical protein
MEVVVSFHRAWTVLTLPCFLALLSLTAAGQDKKDDPASQDKEVISSKGTKRTDASSINFRKELDLPLQSLHTLGARIEAARRAPDPVALAHTASELNVAEQVSGKSASLTSKQLIKEAAELAAMRRQVAELKSVLQVTNQVQTEADQLKSLRTQIGLAQEQIKSDQNTFKSGEEPTSTPRKIIVNNYTPQTLDVYANGNFKATVGPGETQTFMVEHRFNPTTLMAYGNQDINNFGPISIWGRFNKYTWNINP